MTRMFLPGEVALMGTPICESGTAAPLSAALLIGIFTLVEEEEEDTLKDVLDEEEEEEVLEEDVAAAGAPRRGFCFDEAEKEAGTKSSMQRSSSVGSDLTAKSEDNRVSGVFGVFGVAMATEKFKNVGKTG